MLKPFKSNILNFINLINKDDPQESLEAKIYHSFCYISIIASLGAFLINLFIEMYTVMWVSGALFLTQMFCCYLSKVRGKFNAAIFISFLSFHTVICINYFYNSGISGPTFLLTTLTLFFIVTIENKKTAFYWLIFNVLLISILISTEYFVKDSIIVKYEDRESLFIDVYLTYLIVIGAIYKCVILLRKKYHEQKSNITQKAVAFEKLNIEKDKLFSLISHDLRTPLTNVQQYLEMIATVDLNQEEKQTLEKDLLNITRNAQDLLTNLLQWSRNQMEGVSVKMHAVNFLDETRVTLSIMQLLSAKKNINLVINVEEQCCIYTDVDMLNLIIRNLLHNAIKFTPFGGMIEINAKNSSGECTIFVRDNGVGIVSDQKKDLFSLKSKTTFGTNKEKGTGIGLMLCKEYVEMQKGKIWFTSEENKGTTFYMSFKNEERIV